jgi:nucleotidyltransferase substrate binding protein (TIGR01987 family)
MQNRDIRWQQRFHNYKKAIGQLERFVAKENLNEMEEQGLIKSFEYTYELAWKTLQDLLKEKGYKNILGPKPVIEQSFADGYIEDGKAWMRMHNSRNLTSHTYDEESAKEIISGIRTEYYDLLLKIKARLAQESSSKQGTLFDEE